MAMDPVKPEVTITLGRVRHLRFTFGAARRFKKETGKSMFDATVWAGIDEDLIPTLIWSLLVNEDRDISVDDVAELMDLTNLNDITGSLNLLYGASVPASQEGEEDRPTKPDPSQN